jgi:hypothetical protein
MVFQSLWFQVMIALQKKQGKVLAILKLQLLRNPLIVGQLGVCQLREENPVMNALFTAAAEVTEEAILNSLSCAVTTTGRKRRIVKELPYHLLKSKFSI